VSPDGHRNESWSSELLTFINTLQIIITVIGNSCDITVSHNIAVNIMTRLCATHLENWGYDAQCSRNVALYPLSILGQGPTQNVVRQVLEAFLS